MLDATWVAAVATSTVVLISLVGMWTRINTRIAALETEMAAMQATLRRIEDAIWAQAGIAVLRPAQHRHGQS